MTQPVWSVVVCAFNCRATILDALASLHDQDLDEEVEVIVVRSGAKGCEAEVAERFPSVRLLSFDRRLLPGPARNEGVRAARGEFVAFVPDDGTVPRDWLRHRLAKHREGHPLVGGAITNGTPASAVGTANYLLEYSALMPNRALLAEQQIPHCLSFERAVFDRVGLFPEGTDTGEDTIFSRRCAQAGETVGFEPRATLAHNNLTGLKDSAAHHLAHGRGLVQAVERTEYRSAVADLEQSTASAAVRLLVVYPSRHLILTARRLWRHERRELRRFLSLVPLIAGGLLAAGLGAFGEWRAVRLRSPRSS
jgi:GT2 family glycosyltransferase